MYQVQDSGALVQGHRRLLTRRAGARVPRTVVLLGLTSLLTDVSSEMVAAILPLYLVYTLGATPFVYGIIDGLYQGAAALIRVAAGFAGDRWRRHKETAVAGYGLSAVCKLGLLVAGSAVGAVAAIVLLDRTGKGIRTAPRDALISLSARREQLGAAFGVHRAMDTTGAMLGPLVAFGLLALIPLGFDAIFVVSFCFAILGLSVLVLFVPRHRGPADAGARGPSLRDAARTLGAARFRAVAGVAALLGVATVSDGFLFLGLQRQQELSPTVFPLLAVGSAAVFMVLAVPIGRLADRVGRLKVFLGGYALLLAAYGALLAPLSGSIAITATLALLGAYYAATDGVLMAVGSALLPEDLRGSGLGVLGTATSISRLLASVLFGLVWTLVGFQAAIVCFAAALAASMACAGLVLRRSVAA
jgi:MFS family permease